MPHVVNTLLINSVSPALKPKLGNVLITRIMSVEAYRVLARLTIIKGMEYIINFFRISLSSFLVLTVATYLVIPSLSTIFISLSFMLSITTSFNFIPLKVLTEFNKILNRILIQTDIYWRDEK